MGQVIAQVLPLALAIVASAAAIIALVILLMGGRGRALGAAFTTGWLTGTMGVVSAALIFGLAAPDDSPRWALWTKVVLGSLLLILAVRKITQARAQGNDESEPPAWMSGLAQMGPAKAAGLGALLAGINPKNLLLGLAAGATIVSSGLSVPDQWIMAVTFAVVASLGVIIPFVIYLVLGRRADSALGALRVWMERNSGGITITILIIFGVKLLADGIAGLA